MKIETCVEDSLPLISKHPHSGCFSLRMNTAWPPTSDSSSVRFAFPAHLSQHSPRTYSKGLDAGFPLLSPKTGLDKDDTQSCSAWKVKEGTGRMGQNQQTSSVWPVGTPGQAFSC